LKSGSGSARKSALRRADRQASRKVRGDSHTIPSDRLSLPHRGGVPSCTRPHAGRAEDIAAFLELKGWAAAAFHGGMNAPEKRAVQDAFLGGEIRVIAAHQRFRHGDRQGRTSDWSCTPTLRLPRELTCRRAGRAGRDLRDAECVLLYRRAGYRNPVQTRRAFTTDPAGHHPDSPGIEKGRPSPVGGCGDHDGRTAAR